MVQIVTIWSKSNHPLATAARAAGLDIIAESSDDNFTPGESRKQLKTDLDRIEFHHQLRPGREILYVWYTLDVEKVAVTLAGSGFSRQEIT